MRESHPSTPSSPPVPSDRPSEAAHGEERADEPTGPVDLRAAYDRSPRGCEER